MWVVMPKGVSYSDFCQYGTSKGGHRGIAFYAEVDPGGYDSKDYRDVRLSLTDSEGAAGMRFSPVSGHSEGDTLRIRQQQDGTKEISEVGPWFKVRLIRITHMISYCVPMGKIPRGLQSTGSETGLQYCEGHPHKGE